MGVIGVSLIVASFVCVFVCPHDWLPEWIARFRRGLGGAIEAPPTVREKDGSRRKDNSDSIRGENVSATTSAREDHNASSITSRQARDKASMPPPPPSTIHPPIIEEPTESEEQTTPKATAANHTELVPSFSISDYAFDAETLMSQPFQVEPRVPSSSGPRPPSASAWASTMPSSSRSSRDQAASSMAPPPRPSQASSSMAPPPRLSQAGPSLSPPSLSTPPQFAGPNSIQRARGPVPNRSPNAPSSSSLSPGGLAPPPTHTSKPAKPSRKVLLQPGRSPLDWARISGGNADLRNVPTSTPYFKVTPSMLKKQTGRKGKDAWMALSGRVYNITPYAEYHPGGVPELMRGAGRDGTKLFGEIHPWVNYENMLSACLIGLLVAEPEGGKSEMDEMD